jgi:WD40 repeat protein
MLKRVSSPGAYPKIVTTINDGSIKIISPVTGACLITGFPIHKDVHVIDFSMDSDAERIFVLNNSGNIMNYDCKTNPCKTTSLWEYQNSTESILCLAGIHHVGKFHLVAGTMAGQLVHIEPIDGKREFIVQAHIAPVIATRYEPKSGCLVSVGRDSMIKLWKMRVNEHYDPNKNEAAVLVFELGAAINLDNLGCTPSPIFAVNPYKNLLAVPHQDNLVVCSYHALQSKLHPAHFRFDNGSRR